MSDLRDLFDSLYSQFILRDFFGKIVPGLLIIAIVAISLSPPSDVLEEIKALRTITWFFISGFAWLISFGIQYLGELLGLIRHYPTNKYHPTNKYRDEKSFYKALIKFQGCATEYESRAHERAEVIREATGNGSLALWIIVAVVVIEIILDLLYGGRRRAYLWFVSTFPYSIVVAVMLLGLALSLSRIHCIAVRREQDYMEAVLEKPKKPSS
ncbi:MAG: hypothetical protein ACE5JU_25245 [Candidatus Binatia bacterium]